MMSTGSSRAVGAMAGPARPGARHEAGREAGDGDVALAAAAVGASPVEAGGAKPVANGSGRRPGGGGCARRGDARHRLEQARLPHLRILRRREAVEEEGIDGGLDLRQPCANLAEREQQLDAAAFEAQAMQVAGQRRPRRQELGGERCQRRIALQRRHVGAQQRPRFDRDEVQALAALRVVAPGRPARKKVVAQAEACLEDDEAFTILPARRQLVAGEKDMSCLLERTVPRVVDIAELGGDRHTVDVVVEARRGNRRRPHGGVDARVASHCSSRSRTGARPRYASTAGLMLDSEACRRSAALHEVSAAASGSLSTWIVNTA